MENIEIIRANSNYIDIISNGTFYRLIKENYYYKVYGYYYGYVYKINPHVKTFNIPAYIDLDNKRFWIYVYKYAANNVVDLEEFTIDKNNKFEVVIDGVLYEYTNDNKLYLTIYPKYKTDEEIIVPKNVCFPSIECHLLKKPQVYLKQIIYKNKILSFDVDKNYNKSIFRIKQ